MSAELLAGYADSEYSRVSEVLICPPDPNNRTAYSDPYNAVKQHQELRSALEGLDIKCHVLRPDRLLPYQSYTRDSFAPTPWGLLIARMGFAARQQEPQRVETWAKARRLHIWHKVSHGNVEGGDIVTIRPGLLVIGINSTRTTIGGADEVKQLYEGCGWEVRIMRYGVQYRHLDVVLGMISAREALCCLSGLREEDVDWLRTRNVDLFPVDPEEAQGLACNVFNAGGGVILVGDKTERVNSMLEAKGYKVMRLAISEFAHDGGGVHCLVQAVVREPGKGAGDPC